MSVLVGMGMTVMNKHSLICALIAGLAFGAPTIALADGAEPASGVRLWLGGAAGASAAGLKSEGGVSVYRGAAREPSLEVELSGGEPAKTAQSDEAVKVVVVHHYHAKIRRLRTQGFYSGHPGKSRRFTQGFYSGQEPDYGPWHNR